MNWDLSLIETQNGGDLQLNGSDLAVVFGIENMPYLAMFGGNIEQSTGVDKVADSKDWWGNDLFMKADIAIQFNSLTERIINNTALTSGGRIVIENAILKDLEFLSEQAVVSVEVLIEGVDRLKVNIRVEIDTVSKVVVINFKKIPDGDWVISDFNNDFLL